MIVHATLVMLPSILISLTAIVAIGAGISLSSYLIWRIWRIPWKPQESTHSISLRNAGNLDSAVQIQVVSPSNQLEFKFILDERVLPFIRNARSRPLPRTAPVQVSTGNNGAESRPRAVVLDPDGASAGQKAEPGAKEKAIESAEKVQAGASAVTGFARLAISILDTLGSLLPGSAGASLKQQATNLHRSEALASSKIMAPKMKLKQAERLKNQVNKLQVGTPRPQTSATHPAEGQPDNASAGAPAQVSQDLGLDLLLETRDGEFYEYVQTPALRPAEALVVKLVTRPSNPYQAGEYPYWLLTRQVVASGLVIPVEAQPAKTMRTAAIQKFPFPYWALSFLLSTGAIAVNGVWVVLFIRWLSGLL